MLKTYYIGLILLASSTVCWAAHDPTQPPTANKLVLNSIMFSSVQQTAIINGKLVQVDDDIDGSRILKITPQTVIVEGVNGEVTLSLKQYSVKSFN